MPVPFEQMPSGAIIVKEPAISPSVRSVVLYARVSSADQRADLDRQIARLAAYADAQGWVVARSVFEIGSGLNGTVPSSCVFWLTLAFKPLSWSIGIA